MQQTITTYELYVMQGGRWELHIRYAAARKKEAIEEAKTLDRRVSVPAVKLVRDCYNPATGLSQELTIFRSARHRIEEAKASRKRTVLRAPRAPAVSSTLGILEEDDEDGTGRAGASGWGLVTKLVLIILISFVAASTLTGIGVFFLRQTAMLRLDPSTSATLLSVIFIIGFVLSAITLSVSYISREDLAVVGTDGDKPKRKNSELPPSPDPPADEAEPEVEPTEVLDEEPEPDNESEEPPEEEDAEETDDEEAAAADEEERPAEEKLTPYVEAQKMAMMNFLADGLGKVREVRPSLDTFNKFGINLYLAGACELLATERSINEGSSRRILQDAVRVLGTKPKHAAEFAERYPGYVLADPRYLQIFQAGRHAMANHLESDQPVGDELVTALDLWNKPKPASEAAAPVTVVFTDIVGSTDLTQAEGDAAAQQVVRNHNRLVRTALSRYQGREVKHTGDGIMASFTSASGAVEASMAIQREVAAFNRDSPGLPLRVRIGVNAGEPIEEENDLFGTTVQLAARICDKAGPDQILVSAVVRGICAGRATHFVNRGPFNLKGFAEPVTLFEVVWDDAPADEQAEATKEAEPEAAAETEAQDTPQEEMAVPDETSADVGGPADSDAPSAKPADQIFPELDGGADKWSKLRR